jgi:predicted ATP-grasp superfamily ATP-dependent carboligase
MRPLKILVTDGANRAALAITRSLGGKGHRIIVGAKTQPSLAQSSRYCHEWFTYPDPVQDSEGFVETLLRMVREKSIDVVLPVMEITTALIVEQKAEIGPYSWVPFPVSATFNAATNKVEVLALAEKLSIPIPLVVVVRNLAIGRGGLRSFDSRSWSIPASTREESRLYPCRKTPSVVLWAPASR